jgi:hypothetical protein
MLICTRAEKQRGRHVSCTLAVQAHWQQRLLHHLEPATLVGMRWQDYVMWDLVMSRRLWMPSSIFHAYTNNITTLGDVGTTMAVIGNGSYGLHQRCRRIKEASPDAIHNSSTSTSITLSHRKDESKRYYGRLRIYTNDTRHSALARRTAIAMWSS